ncbi:C-type lectin domain family 5 member A-like [Spea bombifrons]|uniref:C-type lectin domain family 5 member A-like n=1 Tax=Spea bombifrons TaxID=233779 RepID=UPI0023490330|nr:C-type lectin domain family 5 member A-like [Spea bombifrons]
MTEEITYADLRFHHETGHTLNTLKPENKDSEVIQVYQEQEDTLAKNENLTNALKNIKNSLCLTSKDSQNASCMLCPVNWLYINGTCYYLSDEELSWGPSRRFCAHRNSTLLVINRKEEMEDLSNLFKKHSLDYVWIGLEFKGGEKWTWIDNTVDTIFNLRESRTSKCAQLYRLNTPYPENCDQQFLFICEKKALDMLMFI